MSAEKRETTSHQESIPFEQVTALRGYAVDLFMLAARPFSGTNGVGSVEKSPHQRARYRSPESGELWTVLTRPPAETDSDDPGTITVEVETPVPCSVQWPNTYIQEKFVIKDFNDLDDYEYSLSTTTYSPEGQYIPVIKSLDDIQDDHPRFADFGPECTPDHFLSHLLSITQLSAADEVGCEPNPYALHYVR